MEIKMFNDYKDFNNIVKTIKTKRLEDKTYCEMDYIKEIEYEIQKKIFSKRILKVFFPKKYEIYQVSLNNRLKIEIKNVIESSQIYKLIEYINHKNKVDFFNISYILGYKKFIMYCLDNGYINKDKLEKVRELLEDMDFESLKSKNEYYLLVNTQKSFKNNLEELLGT
jgi:hypothetical protein